MPANMDNAYTFLLGVAGMIADSQGIFNINDLKNLNSKTDVAVIGSTVGRKKRIEIIKKAEESGIKISNFNI